MTKLPIWNYFPKLHSLTASLAQRALKLEKISQLFNFTFYISASMLNFWEPRALVNRVTRVPGFQEQALPWKDLGILS